MTVPQKFPFPIAPIALKDGKEPSGQFRGFSNGSGLSLQSFGTALSMPSMLVGTFADARNRRRWTLAFFDEGEVVFAACAKWVYDSFSV